MPIYAPTDENLERAAAGIKRGDIIAFPTETVYGLGADALNPAAVAKIFEAKRRPFFDPLIVHIADKEQLQQVSSETNSKIIELTERFWPGPLTLVLQKSHIIPYIVTSGLDTVACRMPDHKIAIELIERSGTPLAAPSANPFGYLSPTKAEHVLDRLGDEVDIIIDGGECRVGIESTILMISDRGYALLRPGGIPVEAIEEITGKIMINRNMTDIPSSPGQLPYHYSPETKIRIEDKIRFDEEEACFLLYRSPEGDYPKERAEILSENGDLTEAASNLFSSLHRLDKMNCSVIIAEAVPEKGPGIAIMDRLRKASKK